jgi:ABC-type glutathione transport system ATPase component
MLEAVGLGKRFRRGVLGQSGFTVRNISFQVHRGQAIGLVGPSGSGKSTVARMLARLIHPSEGSIRLDGIDLDTLAPRRADSCRRKIQMVFQDPHLALDPKKSIAWTLQEALLAHRIAASRDGTDRIIDTLFAETGLSAEIRNRRPHEISGGQAQRVVIARALSLSPNYLIADEPTSMLDLSVQAMILDLLQKLRRRRNLGILLISHDPAVIRAFCEKTLYMENGTLVNAKRTPNGLPKRE